MTLHYGPLASSVRGWLSRCRVGTNRRSRLDDLTNSHDLFRSGLRHVDEQDALTPNLAPYAAARGGAPDRFGSASLTYPRLAECRRANLKTVLPGDADHTVSTVENIAIQNGIPTESL